MALAAMADRQTAWLNQKSDFVEVCPDGQNRGDFHVAKIGACRAHFEALDAAERRLQLDYKLDSLRPPAHLQWSRRALDCRRTLLHDAVEIASVPFCEMLLSIDADPNLPCNTDMARSAAQSLLDNFEARKNRFSWLNEANVSDIAALFVASGRLSDEDKQGMLREAETQGLAAVAARLRGLGMSLA